VDRSCGLSFPLSSVTNALICAFGPGCQCAGFRFDVDELPLVLRNFSRRRPVLSVGREGRSRCQRGSIPCGLSLGTQQQIIATAISMGEKSTRHHDAPIGSWVISPKMLIAQSIRSTAEMMQLIWSVFNATCVQVHLPRSEEAKDASR
jgi:hypothetical protein